MTWNRGFDYEETLGAVPRGTTLLEYLVARYSHSTTTEWRQRIAEGRVRIDGRRAMPGDELAPGTTVSWRRPAWKEPDAPRGFAILHLDEHLLAVAKPAGLPTLPGAGFLENTLLRRVRGRFPDATPLHRLGRWTSGLLLFALSAPARVEVARAWAEGRVGKRYRALATGAPEHDDFPIDVPIGRVPHPRLGEIHAACPAGKPARSRVHVLERRAGSFLAEVAIETGRPHQIRIHLAAAGHPLVGDPLYERGGGARGSALPGDGGYRLHALELVLSHPGTGAPLRLFCAPPAALRPGLAE